jgi:tetratricopeptide (TPR) repeat protein
LGWAYKVDKQYREAESNYRKALAINQKQFGENHPETATIYNNLATMYRAQNNLEKALSMHHKSLNIRKKSLGTSHPKTTLAYRNIGFLYKQTEQLDSAKVYFKKAVDYRQKYYRHSHPDIAEAMYYLGTVYGLEKDWENCERDYRAGQLSIRQLANKNGIPESTVRSRAKAEGWTRDLTEQVRQATRTKLSRTSRSEVAQGEDEEIIEKASSDAAAMVMDHRRAIARWRRISRRLADTLERIEVTVELVLGQAWGAHTRAHARSTRDGEIAVAVEELRGRRRR